MGSPSVALPPGFVPDAPQSPAALPPGFVPDSLSAPQPGTMAAAPAPHGGQLDAIEDPNKLPGIFAQGVASLPTDPDAKAKYLAKSLNIPLDRVGFRNGRVVYLANDGKTYYAEPSFDPLSSPKRTLIEAPQLAASAVGPSLSAAGSIAGGASTPEFFGGIPGAAAGGAVGDAARQGLSKFFTGETIPPMDRALSIAENAALGGAGEGVGKALFKGAQAFANRGNPLKVSGYDLARATPPRINAAEADMNLATNNGVTVTPGEATNMRSLLNRQRQLGRQEEGATPLTDFYLQRNTQQLPSAFDKMVLDKISPVKAPAMGARLAQQGAEDTIKSARADRSAAVEPFYRQAFKENQSISSPVINQILRTPDGQQALQGAVRLMQNDMSRVAVPDPEMTAALNEAIALGQMPESARTGAGVASGLKLRTLDYIKQGLWDIEQSNLGRHGEPTGASRSIGNLRTALTKELDNLDVTAMRDKQGNIVRPGLYAQARGDFGKASEGVGTLQDGLVGLAARDRASGYQNVPATLFGVNSADPLSIASARAGYVKAGKQLEWNAGVRSFLDNAFTDAAKQAQGPAASIWRTIKGDSKQYNNLKAALAPEQLDALDQFMKIAEMVKRAPAEGSQTASDLGAKGGFAGPVARGMASVARAANPLNIPEAVSNWIIDRSAGKNVAQLVDMITSPNSIRQLRQLKMLSPGSKKWTAGITNLIAQGGAGEIPSPSPDQPLGYLLQAPSAP